MSALPNTHPVDRVLDKLRDLGCNPKQTRPGQWDARCPVTDGHKNGDKNPSLSVGTGSDGKVLVCCQKGCKLPDVATALGLGVNDLFPPKPNVASIANGKRITATYDYYDADGDHVFQVVRYTPKGFSQRRHNERGGWVGNLEGITERPLYMLPQIRKAINDGRRIWMTEGEKDAEALQWAIDGAATCNSGGATKWRAEYADQLAGAKRITLIQDNDAKGLEHVKTFAKELLAAGFGDVDVVAPPAPFKDTAEALGAGRTPADFVHVWDNSESTAWLTIDSPEADPEPDDDNDTPDQSGIGDDWAPIDLISIARQIIDGTYQPTVPTILEVAGAIPLFYRERVNLLFGESGGGKTWLALAAVAETVATGQRVLFVDYEDNPNGIAERLVILGMPIEHMRYIDYRNPSSSILVGADTLEGLSDVYALVILDSTGEAMAAGGINSNDDGEVAQWFALVKRLLKLPGKPAIITLDHVPKNQDGTSLYAIGSQRKRAAITGASYRVDTIREPAKGKDGKLKLTVAKDRPGNRPKGSIACHVDLHSLNDGALLKINATHEATGDGGFRPTVYMERVSRWLEDHPKSTARDIRDGVIGKTQVVMEALAVLVREGAISVTAGGRGAQLHTVVTPFREADAIVLKPISTPQTSSGSLVPSGSQWFPGTTQNPNSEWFPGSHPLSGNQEPLRIGPSGTETTDDSGSPSTSGSLPIDEWGDPIRPHVDVQTSQPLSVTISDDDVAAFIASPEGW